MPAPRPLNISPEPWLRSDINPGLAHILSAPDAMHSRATIAVVDDPLHMEANITLFMGAAEVFRDGWELLDAIDGLQGALPVRVAAAMLRVSLTNSVA